MSRGNVTITWTADQWKASAIPALNQGLTAAAAVMANQAVENFGSEGGGVLGSGHKIDPATGKRKGKLYRRGKARYIPSPPGSFPGIRTSNLRNSIAFVSPESLGTPLHAAYGTRVKYGRHLEFGTSKMPARPWAIRTALMARAAASAQFTKTTAMALKAGGLSQ